ncbi:hypothetical protein ACROYT_G014088 [Oculina patagonica]
MQIQVSKLIRFQLLLCDTPCQEVVYQATVTTKNKTETYIGLTANNFKARGRRREEEEEEGKKNKETEKKKQNKRSLVDIKINERMSTGSTKTNLNSAITISVQKRECLDSVTFHLQASSIAPQAANTFGSTTIPRDTFMDMARCIRALIYSNLNKPKELCEVPKLGDNKDLNRQDLHKEEWVVPFSIRCWEVVLQVVEKFNVNYYFFQWPRTSTPEEVVYNTLMDLIEGRTRLKDINKQTTHKSNLKLKKNDLNDADYVDCKSFCEVKLERPVA